MLALRRVQPRVEVGLGVERQDRHPVVLDAGDGRIEPVALKSGVLRLRRGNALVPDAIRLLLTRFDVHRDDCRNRISRLRRLIAFDDVNVVATDQHRLRGLEQPEALVGAEPGLRLLASRELLQDDPVDLLRWVRWNHLMIDETREAGDDVADTLLPFGKVVVTVRKNARLRDDGDRPGGCGCARGRGRRRSHGSSFLIRTGAGSALMPPGVPSALFAGQPSPRSTTPWSADDQGSEASCIVRNQIESCRHATPARRIVKSQNRSARLRSADFRCSVASHFTFSGAQALVTDLGLRIRVVACDSARTHVTWRPARPGKSGPRAVVALTMSMGRRIRRHPEGTDMNLNTIEEVRSATAVDGGDVEWREGDSWLAGGTWLFSEPQPHLRRLLDLRDLGWPPLEVSDDGLRIAATCTIADLYAFPGRPDWPASFVIDECCRVLPRVVQDLEHGHRRRQHLHVPAGGPDDLAGDVAGRGLHPEIARRQRAPGARPSSSSSGTIRTCCCRASCCAPSTSRPRRCASGRRFAGCR